jgi:endo-1,4-beta-xylanase
MKKYLKICALVLVSLFLLTACKNESSITQEEAKEETATESVEESKPMEEVTENIEEAGEDAPSDIVLYKCVEEKLGAFFGCEVTGFEADDKRVMDIATTHFNAITLGNELKPDSLFNYSNARVPGTETVELNGEELLVPVLNYSRPEKILNKILKFNEENPDHQIKVRGHVLVWHSQIPNWFFHVDYDESKDYVTKEEMDKRLEWYIKTVLNHFVGEESKYKDLFYGWDVVNEAVSDNSGYRKDTENSEWWKVYQSEEFIMNAFVYANKYAPSDLELYYNDYNECTPNKREQIVKLIESVKETEGARIDAFGMQGHYDMTYPSEGEFKKSLDEYVSAVGKIQITEFDIKSTTDFSKVEDGLNKENEKLKNRYELFYKALCEKQAESPESIEGITFWGTVDYYSWLQHFNGAGGGSTEGLKHIPLLFDDKYEPKPCFYVFANID